MNEELINNIKQWFHDKGIIEKSNSLKQLSKTQEELNETRDAAVRHDVIRFLKHNIEPVYIYEDSISYALNELKDGIGDTVVTLIGVCEMTGYDFMRISKDSLFRYRKILSDLDTIKLLDEIQSNLLSAYRSAQNTGFLLDAISKMLAGLQELASGYNFTLNECLEQAYDEISKRTGEVVDGVFVKDKEVQP